MTDETKKPNEDELSEEQLDDVTGGATFSARTQTVMDNIAGQTETVKGSVSALSAANAALNQLSGLTDELSGSQQKDESDSMKKGS